jgi:hypothetical protein
MKKLKILAIEPYYDGSHKAFMDAFIRRSVHDITLLTMPARKWKWRMRGAAVEMAERLSDMEDASGFDALFTCDMLNLAEFKGLCGWNKPAIVYFHENQFTYPNQLPDERDFQFGITNLTSVLASDCALFNSRFHLEDFYAEGRKVLKKMPDFKCLGALEKAKAKSSVVYPGIEGKFNARFPENETPIICWAARWEHDKNPEDFFRAVELLLNKGLKFKISVLGQEFANSPAVFAEARGKYAHIIERCGWIEVFNQDKFPVFKKYVASLVNAKRLEVCSTSLPQYSIPKIIGDPRYLEHLEYRKRLFEARANEAYDFFSKVNGLKVNVPHGAFYMSVLFEDGLLNDSRKLQIKDPKVRRFVEEKVQNVAPDKRFVYYLLAAKGICVVPLTGFCCNRAGFRITLLEMDDEKRVWTWQTIADAIEEYLAS